MAVHTTTWLSSLKLLFMSTGVLSIAMFMNFSFPIILDFMIYQLPSIWSFMASWLRPPYLYVIINGIIISIAASSFFHHKDSSQIQSDSSDHLSENILKSSPSLTETEFVISKSNWTTLMRTNSPPEIQNSEEEEMIVTPERPMALSRFSNRKPVRTNQEGGRGLKVAKQRKHETLENTWKTITDGRHMPLTRHFKNNSLQCSTNLDESVKDMMVKKSATVIDRTSNCNSPSIIRTGRIRKEPSVGHDELNRRVEAFIMKFNEDMRLEREESLRQYKEMINRGAS
ncbi:uncharacterized protein LOC124932454 [Impatiens glandulifera]|uniref:uncharacterized protein LOC124932454 n=1 Tax=Impatiens glandulifera TaxID=253017 RepID=UPI001FB0AB50|nr:uncharacterized protein LOC124932454 [Impatiens glandulifera]